VRRVLIQLAHPVLERSRVNRHLIEAVTGLEGVTINDLYEVYPDLAIDVKREQTLLDDHDVIVFQHPFYWYTGPAILKEWQDLVLQHGWAYGQDGEHLAGKLTFNAISAGAAKTAYRSDGYNRFTIRELLAPWHQTAHLCGMHYLGPFVVFGALQITEHNDMHVAATAYRSLIEALRDDRIDVERAIKSEDLQDELPQLLRREVA
jgi:glutathione-regulated potassium-efflux system ancillary protein KefG